MKKTILFAISIFILTSNLSSQQFQNASFEDWEDAGTVIDEPTFWSSIKTSDAGSLINNAAPVVWGQSTDAHTGNYSVELTNVLTLGTIIATGTLTNGRIHASFNPAEGDSHTVPGDDRWNTPINARPDSIAVWVKFFPQGDDTLQVRALLHDGEGSIPQKPENVANEIGLAKINLAGEHDTWTRVVAHFDYYKQSVPEYILVILNSGAGLVPIEGSVALFDDVELIYDPSSVNNSILGDALLYSHGSTIFLDKLPEDYIKNAHIELIDLNGSIIWSSPVTSSRVEINNSLIANGLTIVRVTGSKGVYSQKLYLK